MRPRVSKDDQEHGNSVDHGNVRCEDGIIIDSGEMGSGSSNIQNRK